MPLLVKTIVNNPVSSNCHIIYDNLEKRGLVVDPGSEDSTAVFDFIQERGIAIDYVILTHEHFDHTWAADKFGVPVLCSKECADSISDKKCNLSFYFNQHGFTIKVNARCVEDMGLRFAWLGHEIEFIKNRAHSPGGILFTIDKYVVTGDTLLKDLKTVTKLPWANKEELVYCENWLRIKQGQGYMVLAGHGDCFELDNYDLSKIY